MAKRASSPAGFTLMEVLVALLVLGLLLAGLTQGTRFGTMAWRRQSDMVAERDQLDAIDRTLRQLIAGSLLRNSENPDQLSFTGALPEAVGLAGRRADMTLLVDDHHQLTLRWSPRRHERLLSGPLPTTDTRLLDNVERIDIAYWHNGDNATPAGWRQDGDDAAASQLVKLTVIFAESDKRHWPSVIVRSLPGSPSA
jgi:general secretion pathway protein J